MKLRKNLSLSKKAIARGEQIAAETGKSLSAIVEEQLLLVPLPGGNAQDYWSGAALKPVRRPSDKRMHYLKRKHG